MTASTVTLTDPYRPNLRGPQPIERESQFDFADLLDVINPLQHIPGINVLYREVTGDTIKLPATLAGGALFGGLPGLFGAMASAAFESITGNDVAGHVTALFERPPSGTADAYRANDIYRKVATLAPAFDQR